MSDIKNHFCKESPPGKFEAGCLQVSFAKWKTRSDAVVTSQLGLKRLSSIFFSLGMVRDIVPPIMQRALNSGE